MTPFEEVAAAHAAAADEVYGEPLEWRPQTGVGFMTAGSPDPDRPARTIVGTVTRRPMVATRTGVGSQDSTNASLATGRWQVAFDEGLALDLRAGDLVVRTTKRGAPTLRLSEALPIPGRAVHPADQV